MTQKFSKLSLSVIASSLLLVAQLSIAEDQKSVQPTRKPLESSSPTSSTVKLGSSTFTADTSGFNLEKRDGDSSQSISISPSKSSIAVEEAGKFRIDIGALYEANDIKNDIILSASFRTLYAGAALGTYIGVEKGSNLEKFILSQGFALKRGRIKLSAALLRRLTRLDFSEYSKSFDEKLNQRALGGEYAYGFGEEALLQELKTSIVYYDVEGKNLGHIGDIIIDNASLYDWTRVYGGYRGASKLLAEVSASFRLLDALKLSASLGYDSVRYKAMYNASEESNAKLASSASLTYRINDYHKLEASTDNRNTQNTLTARYTHNFGNSLEGFLSAQRLNNEYAMDDTQYRFGINYSFGTNEKHTKLAPLFLSSYAPKEQLTLGELTPMNSVNTNNFVVSPKKVISKEHIASVDKSALGAGDGIAVASDGTLEAIYWDNGGYPVSSVFSLSDSGYAPFVTVREGKLAVTDILGLNTYMQSQGLTTGQTKTLNISVNDSSGVSIYQITITKGSARFNSSKKSVKGVGSAAATVFVSNTLDSRISDDLINGILPASVINKLLEGTITPTHIAAYKEGTLSATQLSAIKPISELLAEKSAALAQMINTLLSGATAPATQQAAYNAARSALENATTQDDIAAALESYNTALPTLNTAITTENTTYTSTQKSTALTQLPNSLASGATTPTAQQTAYNNAKIALQNATTPEAIEAAIAAYNSTLAALNTEITTANTANAQAQAAAAAAAADAITPNAFAFVDQTGVALSTLTESAAITISGISVSTAISVSGGEYQIDGGGWTSAAGSVTNAQSVKVRHTSSASNSTATNTTLTIGGVSDTFTTTTTVSDTTPNAFSFVDQTGVALSTSTESAAITISGISASTAISVSGGEYQIDGGAWTSAAGSVTNAQSVKVRHTSSASNSTATNTTLTIGGVSDTFTTMTNHAPTASNFTYATAVAHKDRTFSWLALSAAADSDGNTMSAVVQTQGTKGTAVVNGNNVTYTPSAYKSGSDTVTLAISDGHGGTKNIVVTVNSIDTTNGIVRVGNIVTDANTGLQWQDDTAAATYKTNWATAGAYCSALTVDGIGGWRLPTLTELQGIVDTGNMPTIKSGFANTALSGYWSSTEYDADYAWYVYFSIGTASSGLDKTFSGFNVQCVR